MEYEIGGLMILQQNKFLSSLLLVAITQKTPLLLLTNYSYHIMENTLFIVMIHQKVPKRVIFSCICLFVYNLSNLYRQAYCDHQGNYARGMMAMMSGLALKHEGRHHSGIGENICN